jgi:hypothetical protein
MIKHLLLPAIVLVLWSLVVLVWLGFARAGAVRTMPKEALRKLPRVGGRGQDLDPVVPGPAAWPSHNYAHLMEQPTLFYATIVFLALLGQHQTANVWLAWGYVLFRIAHSLWQILVNTVAVRFALFLGATACLLILAVRALLVAL